MYRCTMYVQGATFHFRTDMGKTDSTPVANRGQPAGALKHRSTYDVLRPVKRTKGGGKSGARV